MATVLAAALTPVVRTVANALGAVDAPGERRMHTAAIPRMGGLAIVLAYVVAMFISFRSGSLEVPSRTSELWGLGGGGLVIVLAGLFDDVRSLGAKRKLLAQIVAATLAWYGGARIYPVLELPWLGTTDIGLPLSYLGTLLWIMAFTNAINLIDGLDGLAGGVVFFAALTNVVIAFITGNELAAALNGALAGAVLGFLFYNFNPAKIFMGDTGSLFLGYILSAGALMSGRQKESTLASLLVPMIALGLPLADTLLAMTRRVLSRRSIFAADREHLHHRLLAAGLTHRRAVLVMYGCSIALCAIAIGAAFGKDWQVGAALLGAVLVLSGIVRFAGYFELLLHQRTSRAALLTPPTQAMRRALPKALERLGDSQNRASVLAALEAVLEPEHFAYADITAGAEDEPIWSWRAPPVSGRREGRVCPCEFSIALFPGAERGVLRFGCVAPGGHVSPQHEVLLQVVADAAEAALVRVHAHAPGSMIRGVGVA